MFRKPAGEEETRALDRILMTSFAIMSSWDQWMERVGRENLRVVEEGARIIGGLGFYRMAAFFGGKSIPLAGVAGVGITPERRGAGHAKSMCTDLVRELAAEGVPLAGLYASTTTLYRSVGFEQAGAKIGFRASPASFGKGTRDLACREVDPAKWEIFKPLYDARAVTWTGHLDRTPAIWERTVQVRSGVLVYAYVFGAEEIEGYVILHQTALEGRWFDVRIRDCVLATPKSAKRLAALLHDLQALTRWIDWSGCAADPLVSILPEPKQDIVNHERWMLRILDVVRALEARGYPSISGEVHLRVRDALVPANDGTFVLRVENGKAMVERGGRGDVSIDVRGLAAMYSGFAHPSSMRAAGLIDGDGSMLATLFAGPEPWCCDHY